MPRIATSVLTVNLTLLIAAVSLALVAAACLMTAYLLHLPTVGLALPFLDAGGSH